MSSFFKTNTKIAEATFAPVSLEQKTLIVPVSNRVADPSKAQMDLESVEGPAIVMYGSDRQKEIGKRLDDLLAEITKGSSPVLFELFTKLKKGVQDTNLAELEQQIRTSLDKKWWHRWLDSVGLSSSVKRLQDANSSIEGMLTTKTKSLKNLTQSMEIQIQNEVVKLIADSGKLATLAIGYSQDVTIFGDYVTVGRKILADSKTKLEASRPPDNETDALKIQAYKNFEQKVQLFESRLMVLESVWAKSPGDLEIIRLSQGASLSTLGETANSSLQEFNDIKSALINLSVTMQIKSVQTLNTERRVLRDSIQNYGMQTLGQVTADAAKAQGINRLNDAQRVLDMAKNINTISDNVLNENKLNQQRFSDARAKLTEVKNLLSKH